VGFYVTYPRGGGLSQFFWVPHLCGTLVDGDRKTNL
jgi:hypothetical protein